jgi:Ca2+/Na+ antiporter
VFLSRGRVTRAQGAVLLGAYAAYVAASILVEG